MPPTVRLGVNTWIWASPLTTDVLEALLPTVLEVGAEHLEIALEVPDLLDSARAASLLSGSGLSVSVCAAIGPDRDLIHPDRGVRENAANYLRCCIETTAALGGRNLVGPLYSAVGRVWSMTRAEREADTALLVEQLKKLATYAAEHGVTLCLEPLNRFETSFINLTSQALEVVQRVNHPALGLMLDTFHMNIEERSLGQAITLAGPWLKHLHACENDRGAPGSGHVPWLEVKAALGHIGFDGPVVIESFTDQVRSIARAAAIWRPLAESQDALARDGLHFLRGLLRPSN